MKVLNDIKDKSNETICTFAGSTRNKTFMLSVLATSISLQQQNKFTRVTRICIFFLTSTVKLQFER